MQRFSRRAALLGVVAAGLAACSKAKAKITFHLADRHCSSTQPDPRAQREAEPDPLGRHPAPLAAHRQAAEGQEQGAARRGCGQGAGQPQSSIRSAASTRPTSSSSSWRATRTPSGYSGTRLVPVFHSRMADTVEPVRSIRPVDIPLLSPMDAIIGNTGAAPWVINYVKHYRAHLEGMLSYLTTVGTGSYGTDPSRVYTYNGQTYYDRATICHPKVLAKQTKRFRAGPPQLYFPFASTRKEVSAAQGKTGPLDQDSLQGRRLFHGLQLRQEDEALSAQHAVGSARDGRRHPDVDRQRARDQGEAALRQDLPWPGP